MGDLYVWLISFFFLIALIVIIVFQLMCLADLEFDYINPYDSSSRINKVILPEYITEGVLGLFYLLTGHWCMSLLCGPYLYYNLHRKTASGRCDGDIQHASLGKKAATFQTLLSHFPPLSDNFLDDFYCIGRT
ncbi:protein cornichon homolog 4 isoform X2 [Manihot esculenta]|uniref:protein cornichon homolog 4 isoform X2 n=1 Tax=Manihot esculenta TaxID=3983 RepID=UPI000B5D19DB|nr:protein cornichon homolog 4 isoform X2 [Manihot esculenta]